MPRAKENRGRCVGRGVEMVVGQRDEGWMGK